MLIKSEFKYYILLFKLCFVIAFIAFGTIGGCGGGDDPDIPPPVVGDDDDDVVGDDDDDVVGDDDDDIVPPVGGMGAIRGKVTSPDGTPLNAVHVRAVNTSNNNQLSAFSGIIETSNTKISNTKDNNKLTFPSGIFLIENVPTGNYRVLIEKMDSRNLIFEPFRYGLFVINNNPTISFPDEYYNGADESSTDNPLDFDVVTVNAGQTTQNINIIANGPDGSPPPPSACPSGEKECTGVGCIPNSSTCCGDGTFCEINPICADNLLCCPPESPLGCPDDIQCVSDLSDCPSASACPSGQKECTGFPCILNSSTCCGDETSCPADFPICTNQPLFCCTAEFPLACPDGIFCVNDLSNCP